MPRLTFDTPTGPFTVTEDGGAIIHAEWTAEGDPPGRDETPLLIEARRQIADYYAGTRAAFDLPLDVQASAFQRAVCDAMLAIPLGETRTYGEIAKELNHPAQAIGQALAQHGLPGCFDAALALAGNPALLTRTHFARHLIERWLDG